MPQVNVTVHGNNNVATEYSYYSRLATLDQIEKEIESKIDIDSDERVTVVLLDPDAPVMTGGKADRTVDDHWVEDYNTSLDDGDVEGAW